MSPESRKEEVILGYFTGKEFKSVTVEEHVTVDGDGVLLEFHLSSIDGADFGPCPPGCAMRPPARPSIINESQ